MSTGTKKKIAAPARVSPVGSPAGRVAAPRRRERMSYNAVSSQNKRRSSPAVIQTEDKALEPGERRRLVRGTTDQARNFAVPGWMMRKHVDLIAPARFQAASGNPDVDRQFRDAMREFSRPENCDVRGRLSFEEMIRLMEHTLIREGDAALIRLNTGQLAAIEGSRICEPGRGGRLEVRQGFEWVHGVELNAAGRAVRYCICKHTAKGQLVKDMVAQAENVYLHASRERIEQVRGVTPFAPALDMFKDLMETLEYQHLKAKAQSLYGIAFKRQLPDGDDGFYKPGVEQAITDAAPDAPDIKNHLAQEYDHVVRPAMKLELDPGEDVSFLESNNPSTEFQNFTDLIIRITILALDFPWTFYNSRGANFSNRIGDNLQYQRSAIPKQKRCIKMRDWVTEWKRDQWVADGTIVLPAGMEAEDVRWRWIPAPLPRTDPTKELKAAADGIDRGVLSPVDVIHELGRDPGDVLEEIQEFYDDAVARGLPINLLGLQQRFLNGGQAPAGDTDAA